MTALASRGQLRASFLRWSLFAVPVCLLGVLPGRIWTADSIWFQSLVKPATFPPPVWFGIVWTTLFVLINAVVGVYSLVSISRLTVESSVSARNSGKL